MSKSIVGALPVEHSTDPNGSLCLTVPIKVPPAKLSPEISLSYHSAVSGMSVLGIGWDIHAFGLVQRTAATIAQDGFTGTIGYNNDDRYSLNGQRLMRISGDEHSNEYRYEVDQRSKIVAIGSLANPDYWIEYLPDGHLRRYGNTNDSNLKAVGFSATRIWALSEEHDPFANYASYAYTTTGGFLLVDSISYGGNTTLGMAHQRQITFYYETRNDVQMEFVGGYPVSLNKRLVSIRSKVKGSLVHNHVFNYGEYAPVTRISRLKSVTLSDASSASVLPLTFDWSNSAAPVFDDLATLNSLPAGVDDLQVLPLSVSGSGRTDVVLASKEWDTSTSTWVLNLNIHLADGKGNISPTPAPGSGPVKGLEYPDQLLAMDVDGDGKTDLLHIFNDATGGKHVLTVLLSTADRGYAPQQSFTFEPPVLDGRYYTGDFQGNGNIGLVYLYDGGSGGSEVVCLIQFISKEFRFTPQDPVNGPVGVKLDDLEIVIADSNGNGASDIYLMSSTYFNANGHYGWEIDMFESQKGFLRFREDPFDKIGAKIDVAEKSAFLALPEEDGKTGLLLVSDNGHGYLQYQTLRNTGKSLFLSDLESTKLLYDGNVNVGQTTSITSLDLVNVVHLREETQVSVLHFFNGIFVNVEEVKQPPSLQDNTVNFVDLRGFGRTDCLFTFHDKRLKQLELSCLPCASAAAGAPPDYIIGYTGGLGATMSVVYASLTDSTVYTISTDNSGPANPYVNALSRYSSSNLVIGGNSRTATASGVMGGATRTQLIRFPKYIVKELSSCALPSAQPKVISTAEYHYADARVAFDGRGWLGFNAIIQISNSSGTATTSTYMQEFPFIGQLSNMEIRDAANAVLENTTYKWERHPPESTSGPQCFVTVKSIQQTSYEKGTASYTVDVAHDYDSFANLTQTKFTIADKPDSEFVISKTYKNDEKNWIIGSKLSETAISNGSLMSKTTYTYLPDKQVVNQTTKWVSESSSLVENLSFDPAGNLTKSDGPWQAQKSFTYDPTYSFPIKEVTAVNDKSFLTTTSSYDYGLGELVSHMNCNGFITERQYDILGRVIQISEGASSDSMIAIEKREYKLLDGNVVCVRETLCDSASQSWGTETSYLDGLGRTWKKAVPNVSDPSETVYSQVLFDAAGRIAQEYRSFTSKTPTPAYAIYSYDGFSRRIKAVFPPVTSDVGKATITYDYSCNNGQTILTETKSGDQKGSATTKTVLEYFPNTDSGSPHFVVPLAVSSIDEEGQAVSTVFDALHRAISTADPKGVCLSQEWDGLSRLTRRTISNPIGLESSTINDFSITYDDTDGTKTITNLCTDGQSKIVFTQDRLSRVTKRTTPDHETNFIYDDLNVNAQGQLSSVKSSTGVSEAYSYDQRGCMQTSSLEIDGKIFTTSLEYTTGYELKKITNPDNSVLTNTFFTNSNALKQVELRDSNSNASVSNTFSDFGNGFFVPQVCDMGNGLNSTAKLADNGVPTNSVLSKGSTPLLQQTWTLNSYGRLKAYNPTASGDTARTFEYSPNGQLVKSQSLDVPSTEYKYDASGNILSMNGKTFVNHGWQLFSISDQSKEVISSFEYTSDGHLWKERDGSDKVVREMTYDSLGQMTNLNSKKFAYDSRGRMVKATTGNSVTYYPSMSYEVTVEGEATTQTAYLFHQIRRASISSTAIAGELSEPSVLYYHYDHLGSVIAVSDGNGKIVTTYSYDNYGVTTVESGDDISRYKYSGKEQFEGLIYFGARFYDPRTGRFTSLDKISLSLENITPTLFNQYTFSRNDPVNFIDWNGNMSFWWHMAWHVAIDLLLIGLGIVAGIIAPEAPIISETLIGAGIGGLQYDGEAAYNAIANHEYHMDDKEWVTGIAFGAVMGMIGGGTPYLKGFSTVKTMMKPYKAVTRGFGKVTKGIKWGVNKVGLKFKRGPLTGRSVGRLELPDMVTDKVSTGSRIWHVAKGVVGSSLLSTGSSVGKQVFENVVHGKATMEGTGQAAIEGAIGGSISGGINQTTRAVFRNAARPTRLIAHQEIAEDTNFPPEPEFGSILHGKSRFWL